MDSPSASKVIPRDLAEEYFAIHKRHSQDEKRLKVLKNLILPHVLDGMNAPEDMSLMFENRPQDKPKIDWPGYVLPLLVKLLRSKKKAAVELARVQASWPVVPTPALHVVINPNYMEKSA